MKNLKTLLATALLGIFATATAQDALVLDNTPKREHRAIWMTPFLSGNWPSAAITPANQTATKNILINRLNKFKDQNINVIYYHTRSNCDATYRSSYEPWSASVSGTRGLEPPFDPFGFLVEEAHKRGIEVYAWVNPYRYANGTSPTPYGEGELNIENSHPDWLLINAKQSVLNPALEPVLQHIVNVISEIVTNYDVDGVIFDDYFYGQGGTPMSADAEQYAQYTAAGGTLSQADWRRDNINRMVKRVNAAIKAIKPYLCFGISPAGVSSPTNITTEYGLPPISGDWQYNQIYSDPLAWLKAGDVDFISPQIYWPSRYDELCQWWSNAAVKFDRHFYGSVDLSDVTKGSITQEEMVREINTARTIQPADCAGMVFFQYYDYVNAMSRAWGTNNNFGQNMQIAAYQTKALTPLRHWSNQPSPRMTANVRIDGTTLRWDAIEGMRYTVYAYPKDRTEAFGGGQEYLDGITYTNSYDLPTGADAFDWYVAVYDRNGNEYSPLGVGATAGPAQTATLTYPANGDRAIDLFDFKWNAANPGTFTVEIAEDQAFTKPVGSASTTAKTLSMTAFPSLQSEKTYWWRVRYVPVNAPGSVTAAQSFSISRIAITSHQNNDTGVPVQPTFVWTKAEQGAEYKFEISRTENFGDIIVSQTTQGTQHTVPAKTLSTGRNYWARVTATRNGVASVSQTVKFTTVNKTDYTAPTFAAPVAEGATVHINQMFAVQPWEGLYSVTLNLSASNTFPTRSSYTATLNDFATDDKTFGEIKLSSKTLVNGTTYYVRARGTYYVDGTQKTTDWSPVTGVVYSTEAGVNDITADPASEACITDGTLHTAPGTPVAVYNPAGIKVIDTVSPGTVTLGNLTPGLYIIRAGRTTLKHTVR